MTAASELSQSGMFCVVCAVFSGLLHFIGGLILSFVRFGVISKGHHHRFDFNKLKMLDVTYIQVRARRPRPGADARGFAAPAADARTIRARPLVDAE